MSFVKELLEEALEEKTNEVNECAEHLNSLVAEACELGRMLSIAILMEQTDDFITAEDLF